MTRGTAEEGERAGSASGASAPGNRAASAAFHAPVPLWITVAGWYGVVAILAAYFLSTHDYIEQNGLYLFLNTSGAIGVGLLAWKKHAWQAVVLEVVWAIIGLSALWRLIV